MIPIPGGRVGFSESERTELEKYLESELNDAMYEHEDRENRLVEWDRAYVGDPKQAKRNFPWPGAANIEVPVIGIAVDSICARVVNTIFQTEPFWTIRPLRRETEKIAKPLQDYLEWMRKNEFNLYNQARTNVIELVKYGWSWYKVGWEIFRKPCYRLNQNGEIEFYDEVIRRPCVYHVMNRDVITQAGVEDHEQAEWICHRVRLTNNQLRLRIRDGIYQINFEEADKAREDLTDFHEAQKSSPNDAVPLRERFHTLYEFQIDWPYGKDKVPIPMVVTYHRQRKKVVRAVFNPVGFRTLRKSDFIIREGRKEGIGIARRLWQMQEEISTLHRQQVDNSTLANTRFFVGRKNVIRAGTQIWPGRVLLANDPAKDLIPYQLGDVYQSQGVLETRALAYAERASGVSDYQLGRESSVAGSRATATSTLALIQEGNRRFDLNIRDARDVLGQIGRDIITLNQLFRPSGTAYFVQGQDGMFTEEILKMPPEFAATKMAVELTATTATINKEVQKQSLIALMGLVNNYYDKVAQAAMILGNPQVPGDIKEFVVKATQGAKYLMDQIVQTFDIKSIDTVVPSLGGDNANAGGAAGGPAGSPDGPTPGPQMGAVPAVFANALQQGVQ